MQHNFAFMFLTETWLEKTNSADVLTESALPNACFMMVNLPSSLTIPSKPRRCLIETMLPLNI